MSTKPGDPVKFILHSADASAGVAVPIFNDGSNTARTLSSDEYIEVHSVELVAAVSGDGHLFIGSSATPATGQTIARGTVGTNGGFVRSNVQHAGLKGHTLFAIAPAGVMDVVGHGVVRRETTTGRPSWREVLNKGG